MSVYHTGHTARYKGKADENRFGVPGVPRVCQEQVAKGGGLNQSQVAEHADGDLTNRDGFYGLL